MTIAGAGGLPALGVLYRFGAFKTRRRLVLGTAPHVEINYGALPDLQLHVIAPMAYDSPPDGPGHYGVGDIELGAKYRFIQETNGWPQVGIFPLLDVPSGSARNNLNSFNRTLPTRFSSRFGCRKAGVRGRLTAAEAMGSIHFPGAAIGDLSAGCCKNRF